MPADVWPEDELRRLAQAEAVRISPLGEDGATYWPPTLVWCVVVDDAV